MRSLRRINSSRANGARSRGPITLEGKERSSTNALRHGLLAKCIVLENESSECFDELVTQHQERFAPADGVEFAMIEEMVAANWRMRRAWAIENRLMEKAIRNQPPGDEAARIAAAFSDLAASPELNLLHRYEARLHRIYQRALDNLLLLREPDLPNEPSPISGHPDDSGAGLYPAAGFQPALEAGEACEAVLPNEPSPISGHPDDSGAGLYPAAGFQPALKAGEACEAVLPNEPSPISEHKPPGPRSPAHGPWPAPPGSWVAHVPVLNCG